MSEQYDLAVIGAGPGGYVAAIRAAQHGMKTAVIESREVGGTCLNRGCIPTKALLHSAELYSEAADFEAIGLRAENVGFDAERLYARKDEVVSALRGGVEQLFKAHKITLIRAKAVITGDGRVLAGDTEIAAKRILIATGSTPARPPIEGLDLPNVITSDELLADSRALCGRLVIIGGGVIGVEFASLLRCLGSEVTVIEALDTLLPNLDPEIAQNLTAVFKKRGIKVHTGSTVRRIVQDGDALRVDFDAKGREQSAAADEVLVAIGRRPNTEGLFGEDVDIKTERGRIVVDERFRTSMSGVYAIGDVTGGIQLAHMASAEGIAAVEDMLGLPASIDLSTVPSCVYTNPEIASVGLSESEAVKLGHEVETGKFRMSANGKSLIERQDRGFIKVVFDKSSGVILGAQLMCGRATDLISEFSTAVSNKLTKEQLLRVIRPHPTFSEAVTEAVESVDGMSVHSLPARVRQTK